MSDRKDWPVVLDIVLYFLRNLPHSRHGHTPFELTFVKPLPHILSSLKSIWSSSDSESVNLPSYISELDSHITLSLQSLKQRLKDGVVAKRAVHECATFREFCVGQHVMRRNPGLNACLDTSWNGPFIVTDKQSPVNYRMEQKGNKSKGKVVHANLLKPMESTASVCAVVAVCEEVNDCD